MEEVQSGKADYAVLPHRKPTHYTKTRGIVGRYL